MRHALLSYEINGYDDSDFYGVYFDDADETVGQVEIGSTRYANGFNNWGDIVRHRDGISAELLERARVVLENHIFHELRVAEHADVLRPGPNNLRFGVMVRILEDSKPRSKQVYLAGERGDVFWTGSYGQFFAKGYNKPERDNTRVGVRRLDGSKVFVPAKCVRLDREVLTDDELRAKAVALSHHYNFGAMFPRFAWASEHFFRAPKEAVAS